jgi:hypothetical protein
MAQASCRILLVDSSVPRVQAFCGAFAKAGWEIWPGRNVQEALLLAAGLSFEVVVAHESSTRQHPELWEQLAASVPGACLLLHADDVRRGGAKGGRVLGSDPALILAVLMLLIEGQPVTRAQAA